MFHYDIHDKTRSQIDHKKSIQIQIKRSAMSEMINLVFDPLCQKKKSEYWPDDRISVIFQTGVLSRDTG